jgi:uncharacterized BrkB/YihY/UPF0761 family membrane protein
VVDTLGGLLTGIILVAALSIADLIAENKTSSLGKFALYLLVVITVSGVLTAVFLTFARWIPRRRQR